MEKDKNKSTINVWIIIGIISLVIMLYVTQKQVEIMNRKLTCIYNWVNVSPYINNPELAPDKDTFEFLMTLTSSSCNESYVFGGINTN